MSANSPTPFATTDGSAHTPVRGPVSPNPTSPTASAIKYVGIGCSMLKEKISESPLMCVAAITALNGGSARTMTSKSTRTAGLSWHGIHDRA